MAETTKPTLNLYGVSGNAYSILGEANRAAKAAGWDKDQISEFMTEAKSGDYNHLLQTCMKYFDVEMDSGEDDFDDDYGYGEDPDEW